MALTQGPSGRGWKGWEGVGQESSPPDHWCWPPALRGLTLPPFDQGLSDFLAVRLDNLQRKLPSNLLWFWQVMRAFFPFPVDTILYSYWLAHELDFKKTVFFHSYNPVTLVILIPHHIQCSLRRRRTWRPAAEIKVKFTIWSPNGLWTGHLCFLNF